MSSSQNSSSSSDQPRHPFGAMLDVKCKVDIVLGTSVMSVRQVLNMRKHALIRIDQAAGADMEIIVNGIAIAHGEVLIVDDTTSIRVTEVLLPPNAEVQG
jgi:flagellar motor switch protein FliN/FliY